MAITTPPAPFGRKGVKLACEHKNTGADHGGIKKTEVAGKCNFSFW